jgi:DNA ligase D
VTISTVVGLEKYRSMRDFSRTPEPAGAPRKRAGRSFVVQKHAASHLHYDFRLELDGVLKSWSVPKGPTYDTREKRLAVQTEDHPVEYGRFEGIIPEGEYGGGTVMLWDRGRWSPIGDPHVGIEKGRLEFELEGERLRGRWLLVRLKARESDRGGKANWLLFKRSDEHADRTVEITEEAVTSVTTGRSMDEIAAASGKARKVWRSNRTSDGADGAPSLRARIRAVAREGKARRKARELGVDGAREKRESGVVPARTGRKRAKKSSAKKAAAKSAKKTTAKSAKKTTAKSAKKTTAKSAKKTTAKSAKKTTAKSAKKTTTSASAAAKASSAAAPPRKWAVAPREGAYRGPSNRRALVRDTGERVPVAGVKISNGQRVIDPGSGVTKLELARYYESVADAFLEHGSDRPLALVRCPEGSAGECFYQKHSHPGMSKDIHVDVDPFEEELLSVTTRAGVVSLAQWGAVELHGWGSEIRTLEAPDWIVMDLDPAPDVGWKEVVAAAVEMRERLESIGLRTFVKTTGGKGLHVVIPLVRRHDWETVKSFSHAIALDMVDLDSSRFTDNMSKSARGGKIFVDYLRNGRGNTAILPYSARARDGLPVAYPIAWSELASIDPQELTVRTVPGLLAKRRVDPWRELRGTKQSITRQVLEGLERR